MQDTRCHWRNWIPDTCTICAWSTFRCRFPLWTLWFSPTAYFKAYVSTSLRHHVYHYNYSMVPTHLWKQNSLRLSTSHNNFFCVYFLDFNFLSKNVQIPCVFPVFFQMFQILCFPCVELLFAIFPVFPVEWEPFTGTCLKSVVKSLVYHRFKT